MTDYQFYGLLSSLFFIATFKEYKPLIGAMLGVNFALFIEHSEVAQAVIKQIMSN